MEKLFAFSKVSSQKKGKEEQLTSLELSDCVDVHNNNKNNNNNNNYNYYNNAYVCVELHEKPMVPDPSSIMVPDTDPEPSSPFLEPPAAVEDGGKEDRKSTDSADMKNNWKTSLHIPFIVCVEILFFILYGLFARYDPEYSMRNNFHNVSSVKKSDELIGRTYAMFQDVHVMIFIGFGFLMTFLKKYGLSAVSLNMLCSVLSIQWSILVHGFFHPHCVDRRIEWEDCPSSWGFVDIHVGTLLNADFATAAVLISFGVVIGTTNPLQLLVMTFIEIVFYNINEYCGRKLIQGVDAGDTIFVHMFGAYFGLAASWMLYDKNTIPESEKAGANYISDLFSMIGTIFLWMYWPSFNAGAAAAGDAQSRAVINTYLSLCAAVMLSFATSALVDKHRKFCMEHIQNATLAGGVAVGAVADMVITPLGAIIIGSTAGLISTVGFRYVTPFLKDKCRIPDTCGVNNLHGMPSILGGMVSVLLAGIAQTSMYDEFNDYKLGGADSLNEIFPDRGDKGAGWAAGVQMASIVVTLTWAIAGGLATGLIMKLIGRFTARGRRGATVAHLGQLAGSSTISVSETKTALSQEMLYDDSAFFHVEED